MFELEPTVTTDPTEPVEWIELKELNKAGDFHGIMPDIGAARISTGGQPHFRALQREFPSISLDETQAGQTSM
jgi:hypothetical protein